MEPVMIRTENENDIEQVFSVNSAAFETSAEALLVNLLRVNANPVISLVAENLGKIIGHIMFSPVTLSGDTQLKIMGLAPMAVLPENQKSGVGSQLISSGIEACKKLGYFGVVVLGHPEYYPRFGFAPSSEFNIKSEYDVPDNVFMVQELKPRYLANVSGVIKYHDVFKNV